MINKMQNKTCVFFRNTMPPMVSSSVTRSRPRVQYHLNVLNLRNMHTKYEHSVRSYGQGKSEDRLWTDAPKTICPRSFDAEA